MKLALGKDSILNNVEKDLENLQREGWEVVDSLTSKGTTCALILKRE
jgi:hypothetical protein